MIKISVIIPTYNSWSTLKECVNSVLNQTLKPKEIIVVDNGSSDNTSSKVKKKFPKVKLISLKKNTGVTGGRNAGIEFASDTSDYLLFLDHDMVIDKDMLTELVKIAKQFRQAGIITPKIYYWEDKKRIWSAGTSINLWTGQVIFRGGKDIGQFEKIEEVGVAPAAMLVKKEVIKKIRNFDDRYFATYEDTDFCFRAKEVGYKTIYSPNAIAYHKLPTDLKDESVRLLSRAYWVGRNRTLFMKDHGHNFLIFLLFLPGYVIYYLYLSLKFNKIKDWFKFINGIISGLGSSLMIKKLVFTGERPSLSDIEGLHLAKYKFALNFCIGKKVLEIGCGVGYGSKLLADGGAKEITAIDLESSAISFAKENYSHPKIKFIQADVQTLHLAEKFDIILAFEVIEHLVYPKNLLGLAKKNLKAGGIFILSTPNRKFSGYKGDKPSNPYHVYEYLPQELKSVLKKYFKKIDLYGVILENKSLKNKEDRMHKSLRWQISNYLTKKRIIRKIANYLPESPKRFLSGEARLNFDTQDFRVIKNKEGDATNFVAVCR